MHAGESRAPGGSTAAPAPTGTRYAFTRPSYKASCIPRATVLSTDSSDARLVTAGAQLHHQQCGVDRMLHAADITQFEITKNPQRWVGRYYHQTPSPRNRGEKNPSGTEDPAPTAGGGPDKNKKKQASAVQFPSPRQQRLRDEVREFSPDGPATAGTAGSAAGGSAGAGASQSGGKQQQSSTDGSSASKQSPRGPHLTPPTNGMPLSSGNKMQQQPSQQQPLWAPLVESVSTEKELSLKETGSSSASAAIDPATVAQWRLLAERRQLAVNFTEDLEYQAKEFMRCASVSDVPAYILPLDDYVLKIFGGSGMVAKELFEKAGLMHYATIPGAETYVVEEMERRKVQAAAKKKAALEEAANGSHGTTTTEQQALVSSASQLLDDDAIEDDMWFAIPCMSPVAVQKLVLALRQLIGQHLREAEAILREDTA